MGETLPEGVRPFGGQFNVNILSINQCNIVAAGSSAAETFAETGAAGEAAAFAGAVCEGAEIGAAVAGPVGLLAGAAGAALIAAIW